MLSIFKILYQPLKFHVDLWKETEEIKARVSKWVSEEKRSNVCLSWKHTATFLSKYNVFSKRSSRKWLQIFNSPAQLSVHLNLGLSVLQVQRWLLAVGKLCCCHLLRYGPHLLSWTYNLTWLFRKTFSYSNHCFQALIILKEFEDGTC